jgi:putative colanic acid biosynthesis glycosyltransferase
MPSLLQINSARNFRSTGKIVEDIGCFAKAKGWDSYVANSARFSMPSKLNDISCNSKFGEYLHAVLGKVLDAVGLFSTIETKLLIRKIENLHPDIIHLHNIHNYYLNYRILFDYLSQIDIPIVWTLHDCWPITGHCYHFDSVKCNKWETGCYDCPLRKKHLFDRSNRNYKLKKYYFTKSENLTIVTVSQWLNDMVKKSFMQSYPSRVIYNGIDVNIFKPSENDLRKCLGLKNKFIILGVATAWTKSKGLYDYYELCKKIPKEFKIVLLGLNRKQIKRLPFGIIGIEKTNSQLELAQYYSMADVLMSLSYGESMGLTIVESMLCGTPVIVYNNTAQPELITRETGISVETGSIDGVVSAINKVCKRGKASYSLSCRRLSFNCYNEEDRFLDYIQLYNELTRRRL